MIQSNDLYTEDRIYNVFDSEALTHIDHICLKQSDRLPDCSRTGGPVGLGM